MPIIMQMLCHHRSALSMAKRKTLSAFRWAALLFLAVLCCAALAQPQPQPASGFSPQDKVFQEVAQWVVKTQQVSASDFSFAPMDSRVQLQMCSQPLTIDLPFSSRETVRVRCLGNPTWQLYLRLQFRSGTAPLVTSKPASSESTGPVAAGSGRQVVVGKQLLRAGTVLSADVLQEQEHVGPGLDPQAVTSIKDVLNSELIRDMSAGMPLRSHDVRRALLVKMGQSVTLTVSQGSGFSITARVEALQDGRMGDQVRLRNPESGRLLSGVVIGPNAARGL